MLSTFVPASSYAGVWKGKTYQLPLVKQDADKRIVHVNRQQNVFTELEEAHGVYLSSGLDPIWAAFGEIQVTFMIGSTFLSPTNPNSGISGGAYAFTFAGLEKAIDDFILAVVMGGLGTLTEKMPDGNAYLSRYCTAVLNGDYTVQRQLGKPIASIDCTFLVPSCNWTIPQTNSQIRIA